MGIPNFINLIKMPKNACSNLVNREINGNNKFTYVPARRHSLHYGYVACPKHGMVLVYRQRYNECHRCIYEKSAIK